MSTLLFRAFLVVGITNMVEMKHGPDPGCKTCKPTSSDILGPFYLPDQPPLKIFCQYEGNNPDGKDPLVVYGRVFKSDCKTSLPGVKVEMWQADHTGAYKNDTNCRGHLITDKSGFYLLETIYPGTYPIENDGGHRPAHLHFKVNGVKEHKTLITQMYFEGDEFLAADPCTSCSSNKTDLIAPTKTSCFNFKKPYCSSVKSDLIARPIRNCYYFKDTRYCYTTVEFNIILEKGYGEHVSKVVDPKDMKMC